MKNLELKKQYVLSQLIEITKINIQENGLSDNNYCLYTKENQNVAHSNLVCYLENYPTISDDDEEVYPSFVVDKSLELFYDGRQFEDVIFNLLHQKKTATIDEFISALNYYTQNDTFLEIE